MEARDDRITDIAQVQENAYLTEIEANCRMFIEARVRLNVQLLNAPGGPADDALLRRIRLWAFESWGAAYTMIEAARRIVRVLWEVPGCKQVRMKYGLNPSVSFQRERICALRDALEHTESRIPKFVSHHDHADLSGWGVSNNPDEKDDPTQLRFRYLNLATGDCFVEDEDGRHALNLFQLERAIRGILLALPHSIGGSRNVLHVPPESGSMGYRISPPDP